jgi:nicotinamide riboside transporter PnuC
MPWGNRSTEFRDPDGNLVNLVNLAAALVASLLGQVLLPFVLLLLMSIPSWATLWYSKRRGIDVHEMAGRASARSRTTITVVTVGGIVLVMAAMFFTVSTGHGVVPVPEIDMTVGAGESVLRGALVGGAVGAVLARIATARRTRRIRHDDATGN